MNEKLSELIRAGFAGIWIETWEPDEALREIGVVAGKYEWRLRTWDVARGDYCNGEAAGNPVGAIGLLQAEKEQAGIQVLVNFHRFVDNIVIAQTLANAVIEGKGQGLIRVVLAPPGSKIPVELEKLFTVVEHPLPTIKELDDICREVTFPDSPEKRATFEPAAATAALGLTRLEAENAFALSIAKYGAPMPDVVWDLKAKALRKTGCLELHQSSEGFSSLGGLEALKNFCKKALANTARRTQAKGVMLLGVPGTGKSAFAKALGKEVGRPTILFDVGACYGSLVGESEAKVRQALQVADAMSPCILFIDEIEKALSGLGGEGDSGVSSRLFGTVLTWLNDHTSDVFVVATSNNIQALPPEFTRAERWDGVFFLDLPTQQERSLIWRMYEQAYALDVSDGPYPYVNDDGWTGAEIKACCRLASLLNITIREASTLVVPVSATASEKVSALREWASGKVLSASSPGIYNHKPVTCKGTKRRAIARRDA